MEVNTIVCRRFQSVQSNFLTKDSLYSELWVRRASKHDKSDKL